MVFPLSAVLINLETNFGTCCVKDADADVQMPKLSLFVGLLFSSRTFHREFVKRNCTDCDIHPSIFLHSFGSWRIFMVRKKLFLWVCSHAQNNYGSSALEKGNSVVFTSFCIVFTKILTFFFLFHASLWN